MEIKNDFQIENNVLIGYTGHEKIVEIPNGVHSIEAEVFANDLEIEEIILPDTLETIGKAAFVNCENLKNIDLNNVKIVKEYAFAYCHNLSNINLKSVEELGICAFACSEETPNETLKKLVIPGSVETIGERAFQCYSNIEELIIEDGVKTIEYGAFASIENNILKTLTIPGSVETIGEGAFYDYSNIEELIIEDGVKIIEKGAFAAIDNNYILKTLTIPDSVEIINDFAFNNFKNLRSVSLSRKTDIDIFAFEGCPMIKLEYRD